MAVGGAQALLELGGAAVGPARRLMATHRVFGVGAGVFILGFFLLASVVLCVAGSRTRKPGIVYTVSVLMLAVVAAALLGSPKGQKPPPAPEGYDRTLIPLVLMGVLVSAGTCTSVVGLLLFHARAAVYARPLSYHRDVLRQR